VRVLNKYDGAPAELMIALHAWRSAESIRRFRELFADRPLIVALSGTDINEYLERDPAATLRSLGYADRLVALQELACRRVPRRFRAKLRVLHQVRRLLGRARAMVLSSLSEGGANVISEAVAAGVPVLASRIDGSVGLLGRDYPGYFPVRGTSALARLLHRIETEPPFLARLRHATERRKRLFRPEREKAAWRKLIGEITQHVPVRTAQAATRRRARP